MILLYIIDDLFCFFCSKTLRDSTVGAIENTEKQKEQSDFILWKNPLFMVLLFPANETRNRL
nr:MAG TPA: hypothetical protein [Caudoviricetes sp.]